MRVPQTFLLFINMVYTSMHTVRVCASNVFNICAYCIFNTVRIPNAIEKKMLPQKEAIFYSLFFPPVP